MSASLSAGSVSSHFRDSPEFSKDRGLNGFLFLFLFSRRNPFRIIIRLVVGKFVRVLAAA